MMKLVHIPVGRLFERAENRGGRLTRQELDHLRLCPQCFSTFETFVYDSSHTFQQSSKPSKGFAEKTIH